MSLTLTQNQATNNIPDWLNRYKSGWHQTHKKSNQNSQISEENTAYGSK